MGVTTVIGTFSKTFNNQILPFHTAFLSKLIAITRIEYAFFSILPPLPRCSGAQQLCLANPIRLRSYVARSFGTILNSACPVLEPMAPATGLSVHLDEFCPIRTFLMLLNPHPFYT